MNIKETKLNIIQAGHKAVLELIKVAEEAILDNGEDDLAADKLKNAAATKKLAIFDAFEILTRIELEERILNDEETAKDTAQKVFKGFAEGRSK
jgi:ASC-1-like (ASCH) protein